MMTRAVMSVTLAVFLLDCSAVFAQSSLACQAAKLRAAGKLFSRATSALAHGVKKPTDPRLAGRLARALENLETSYGKADQSGPCPGTPDTTTVLVEVCSEFLVRELGVSQPRVCVGGSQNGQACDTPELETACAGGAGICLLGETEGCGTGCDDGTTCSVSCNAPLEADCDCKGAPPRKARCLCTGIALVLPAP